MSQPAINSQWINLKKGSLYQVWRVVREEDSHSFFYVIYQAPGTKEPSPPYYVQHTEDELLIGIVDYIPSSSTAASIHGGRWVLRWKDKELVRREAIAWARPAEMWSSKFRPAEESDRPQ